MTGLSALVNHIHIGLLAGKLRFLARQVGAVRLIGGVAVTAAAFAFVVATIDLTELGAGIDRVRSRPEILGPMVGVFTLAFLLLFFGTCCLLWGDGEGHPWKLVPHVAPTMPL